MSFLLKNVLKIGIPVALTAAAVVAAKLHEQYVPVKEQPHSDAPIIAALGDSITFGSGVRETRSTDTWEKKLEAMLGGSYQVLNYGVSGATLQNEGDMPYWHIPQQSRTEFPEAALALKPEIVLLMLGTNDSKPYNWNRERFEEQLDARVKEILGCESVRRLILMCPPFACPMEGQELTAFDIYPNIIEEDIVPIYKKTAEENGVECLDLFALTQGHPEYFVDGVHPNSFGNHVIAKRIYKYLNETE